jgi:uncharacterized protein (DUF1778 family)
VSTDPPTGRRRSYVFPGRQKRLSIRVTDDEYTEIAAAADQFGLTPTGFCAHAALDAARDSHAGTVERLKHEALGNLQAELFQARVTVNQLRAEPTGRYRLGTGTVERESWIAPLAYADLAEAVLDEIDRPTRHREHVAIYAA